MPNRYPTFVVLGACFLQACTTPVANRAAVVVPVFDVRHSANNDSATYARLGKYHHDRGEFELARAAYLQSIALDRRQLQSRNALAAIDAQQGRLPDAVVLLESVVADYPTLAYPRSNLGYLYYLQGQFNRAVTVLERAAALDPASDRARSNLRLAKAAVASQQELAKIKESISAGSVSARAQTVTRPDAEHIVNPIVLAAPQAAVTLPPAGAPLTAQGRPFLSAMTSSRFDIVKTTANTYELKLRSPQLASTPAPSVQAASGPALAPKALAAAALPAMPAPPSNAGDTFIEITNGNGVQGSASRLRLVLARQGFVIGRLSNAPPYNQQVTEIRYRPGYQNQATRLRAVMHEKNVVLHAMQWTGEANIKLVLGKEAAPRVIADSGEPGKYETVQNTAETGT